MKLVSAVRLTLGCALAAIIVAATLAKDAQQSVSGKVVAQSNANSSAGIPNVRVTCIGPDGTVHDDVGVATTDGKGSFALQVPTKYATFALLFTDAVNHYWPKQLDVSPKKNPLLLEPVQLHPQTLALSANERKDIERIQQTLSGVDPAAASALYAALGHSSTGTDFFATGGGSSSAAIVQLASAYERNGGRGLNYQSVASGAGIKQISAKTVTFGVTDKPLTISELKESGLVQWPTAVTGLTLVVNVPGIQANELILNGQILSDIYLGQIKLWNDAALASLNPKLKLPAIAIVPVHRADGSGASSIFTEYLSKVSKTWREAVGQGMAVNWPGGISAKGNEGVSKIVEKTNGAIAYVDYSFAVQNKLPVASMVNADGNVVAPNAATLQAAIANTPFNAESGFGQSAVDVKGAQSWPLTSTSYGLIHKVADKPDQAYTALQFFNWTLQRGPSTVEGIETPSLPEALAAEVRRSWAANIRDPQGRPVWKY